MQNDRLEVGLIIVQWTAVEEQATGRIPNRRRSIDIGQEEDEKKDSMQRNVSKGQRERGHQRPDDEILGRAEPANNNKTTSRSTQLSLPVLGKVRMELLQPVEKTGDIQLRHGQVINTIQ